MSDRSEDEDDRESRSGFLEALEDFIRDVEPNERSGTGIFVFKTFSYVLFSFYFNWF